jgi:hypothetical protein
MKVKCIDNSQQTNRLTVGKFYNVIYYKSSLSDLYTILIDDENNECNFLKERFSIDIKEQRKQKLLKIYETTIHI